MVSCSFYQSGTLVGVTLLIFICLIFWAMIADHLDPSPQKGRTKNARRDVKRGSKTGVDGRGKMGFAVMCN